MASLDACVDFEVVFPGHDRGKLKIPTEHLAHVFEIVRRGLHDRRLSREIDRNTGERRALSQPRPGSRYLNDASKYLHWVRELFDCLATELPAVARDELHRWPADEPYFFAKLAIYAWGLAGLTDGEQLHTRCLEYRTTGSGRTVIVANCFTPSARDGKSSILRLADGSSVESLLDVLGWEAKVKMNIITSPSHGGRDARLARQLRMRVVGSRPRRVAAA